MLWYKTCIFRYLFSIFVVLSFFYSSYVKFYSPFLACTQCHTLIQDEVHTLRSLLRDLKSVVDNTTNAADLLSDDTFPILLFNLSTSIFTLLANSTSAAATEQRLFKDIQMLNETVDTLQALLETNISRDVNVIRAQIPSVASYQNGSAEMMDTIYNFLWMSVYVINADIQPRIGEIPTKLEELRGIANNISTIASERLTTYAPILKDLSYLLNSTSNVLARTAILSNTSTTSYNMLNDTRKKLLDLSNALTGSERLVDNLYNKATRLMNSSYALLLDMNNTADELAMSNITTISELLNMLNVRHDTLLNESRVLNHTYQELFNIHQNIFTLAKYFMDNSTEILTKVNTRNAIAAEIHTNVTRAKEMVDNATVTANLTYIMAQRMLYVMSDYQNSITNATLLINSSLHQLEIVSINCYKVRLLYTIKLIHLSINERLFV